MAAKLHQGHASGSRDIKYGWILSGQTLYIVQNVSLLILITRSAKYFILDSDHCCVKYTVEPSLNIINLGDTLSKRQIFCGTN